MNTIRIGTYDIELKSGWEELHAKDLQFFGGMFPFEDTSKFHLKLFLHFCKLKFKPWLGFIIYNRLEPEHLHNILTLNGKGSAFGWVLDTPILQKQLFPHLTIYTDRYYGPADQLMNIKMGEFKIAEKALEMYLFNKEEEYLNTFLSAIYRKKINGTTERENYSIATHDEREKVIALLPLYIKHAAMLNYIGMRNFMMKANKRTDNNSDAAGGDSDWGTLIAALAGSATNLKDVEDMYVWKVLGYIGDSLKLEKEKKRQAKNK